MYMPQEQTVLINNGQQAVVPAAMMTDADIDSLQDPRQFNILWGKITKTVPELSQAVRAADPVPDRVPEAVIWELARIDPTINLKKVEQTGDIKDIKPKLMKTGEEDIKILIEKIKNDPDIRDVVKKEEGIKYAEGVLEVVRVKNEMIKCENICNDIVARKGVGVTEQLLQDIIQQACSVAYRFISMGIQFKAELMVELRFQANQLGVISDEVKALSGRVFDNSQWLGNGIKGLHAYQEKMEGQTFQGFQRLFEGLDVSFKQNWTMLEQINISVSSTKEERAEVKKQLTELKEQANQLVLQKNEQVGVLSGILNDLKVRTEEISNAVVNGTDLRAGMVNNIKQYLEHSKALQDRCNELAEERSALETAVLSLQNVSGFFDNQIKARADEISQLSQTLAQENNELKEIGNSGLKELAKVLGGVARLEQAVAEQKRTGENTKALVSSLNEAIKVADLNRVAGLVAAQNQERPDLNSLIPSILEAIENGIKTNLEQNSRVVITRKRLDEIRKPVVVQQPVMALQQPMMTQQQAMDFIKTVASWYEGRANDQAKALTIQLTNFNKILDEMRTKINQEGGQRGPQGFNAPIMVVQQVTDHLNNLKPIAVPSVVDYGRIQFMTPADRIREIKSLAAQPQRRTKSRISHGLVPIKSKLIDPALDEGRDVRRTTKARRVARVKKIERRRTRDPLDLFLQGTYK